MDKKDLNENKEFIKVNNVKKFQDGVNTVVNIKTWQSIGLIAVVLAVIVMLILMAFRQNAVMISKNNPEPSVAMEYDEVQPGEEATNSEYVTFDAYFLKDVNSDGVADKVRGTCKEIGTSDDLYMELNVLTKGYFKDAKITINSFDSEEQGNFYLSTEIAADSQIKENYISSNTNEIEFNTLENGTHVLLSGKVNTSSYSTGYRKSSSAIKTKDDYSKINSIVLTGTHVDVLEDGSTKETQVEKKVEFKVDWYGTIQCYWYNDLKQENSSYTVIDTESQKFNVKFFLDIQDTKDEQSQLIFKTGHIEGILPKINNYSPIDVKIDDSKSEIMYDKETGKFVIERNDNFGYGEFWHSASLTVSYPLAAYNFNGTEEEIIEIPVKGYIEAYNNSTFQNPFKSDEIETTVQVIIYQPSYPRSRVMVIGNNTFSISNYDIYYSMYISKSEPMKLYNELLENNIDNEIYKVQWYFNSDKANLKNGIIMKESKDKTKSDEFIKSDYSTDSMEDLTTNIGVYFQGRFNELLGNEGWIKIYNDETNELIETFEKDDWNKYNSEYNIYKYPKPIKHIRVETSEILKAYNDNTDIYVYNVKELNSKEIVNKYTEEDFKSLEKIKSNLYIYYTFNNRI